MQTPNGDHAVGGGINEGEGGDGDEIKSAAEFARLCYEDPCKGLLKVGGMIQFKWRRRVCKGNGFRNSIDRFC